ncbi:isoprenylcysteine carboxylmethyltransferase family protein [Cohnella endophytica]|uniref:Isoprenylcysteine carboxylmethyltransferase family protein n=1 Tax=Cohnella endophytica TaxID=2419778 RepID=A0A494Y8R5_9BACL|nr:isoprenylcysteine carboxylmethyltransferase family protein [Cohnella endophytica]RKP57988.1 isoprenylcysteine carboxylmethyltransferase family protein [Cohnella endophytica]
MFLLAYIPIIFFFLLEFQRFKPIKEVTTKDNSNKIIGMTLLGMIVVPSFIFYEFANSKLIIYLLIVGMLMSCVGVWIRFSAIRVLGRFYSRKVGFQEEHKVIQVSWYKYIRNPGYLGTLLTYLGFAISTSSWISVIVNIALYFLAYTYRMNIEERVMKSEFKDEYIQYIKKTWRIIPFIY